MRPSHKCRWRSFVKNSPDIREGQQEHHHLKGEADYNAEKYDADCRVPISVKRWATLELPVVLFEYRIAKISYVKKRQSEANLIFPDSELARAIHISGCCCNQNSAVAGCCL